MRTFLHFQAKRNFNVLSYEHQEQIAPRLGYSESPHGEAAETMMRDYFLNASQIARRASMWEEEVGRSRSKIAIPSDFSDPFEMIEAFAEAHRKKASLHAVTLSAIRQRLNGSGGILANNPRAGRAILEMMKDRVGIYDTLLAMHEVGLLGKIFPDFEEIRCRVIRDFFHKYTVDEHSLIAIRNIEELPPKHRFRDDPQRTGASGTGAAVAAVSRHRQGAQARSGESRSSQHRSREGHPQPAGAAPRTIGEGDCRDQEPPRDVEDHSAARLQ